jgi:hypothetical protein
VPPCFNPARGEQGDIPTDNEGVSYGQRRKQVTVLRKQKSAGIPPADFLQKLSIVLKKCLIFFVQCGKVKKH